MGKYLVEVSQPEQVAAKRISRSIRSIGSHFATHADWRHHNGVSTGTMVVEAGDRWGALGVVPPALRSGAKIFELGLVVASGTAAPVPNETSTESYAVAA